MKNKIKTTLALLAAVCGLQLFTATTAQAATTITGAKWGNIGSSAGGIVTNNGGNFGYDDWTLNFSDSSGMYDKQIGGSGKVCIKRIVMVDRPDASTDRRHSKITLTQGSLVVEATPVYHAADTDGISIYNTSGQPTTASSKTVFGWNEYVLTDNTVEFDASMNIAIKLTSPTSGGSGVCAVKPINNLLKYNGWSPAIEITADWTPTRVVSYSVAQCWGSSTTGLLTGEKYATSAGVIPLAGWSQPVTGASDTTVRSDSKGSTLTISKYWDGSAKTFSGVSGFTFASYISGGTNLYGPSGSPTTFDDYRTCVNQALNCNDTGTPNDTITISNIPFESYDVIVYFAGGNKKGTTYTMNSVQVNSGNYYKPNSTTPGDNAISSSDSTWGNSTSPDLIYGTNVMRLNGVVGQSLVLGQRCLAYGIAAIQLVERIAYKATFNADKTFSELEWTPSKPASGFGPSDVLIINNTAAAKLTIDQDVKVSTFAIQNESGKALTLGFDGHSINAAFDKSAASGGVTIDVSGDWGAEIAKYAVAGAPYSYWYIYGMGELPNEPTTMPTMPTGYSVASQKYTNNGGMRLVVTAPTTAKLGAVSVNLRNGNALSSGTTLSGAYPVAHDDWGDLQAAANKSVTVSGVKFTIGSNASAYGIDTYSDEIYRQYMDDSTTTRTISLSGITYAKYRIIVYFSTDTANYNFRPMVVNDGTSDISYAGPSTGKTGGYTVKGRDANWGHTGPDKGMNAVAEGVNYLVTDVMTTATPVLKFTRSGDPRATPCAIQIVEVGVPVSYKATVTEDGKNWSELGWTPAIPSSGMPSWSDCVITNGRDADVTTVNMDSTVSVGKFTVVSATKVLKFGSPSRLTATTYDFSQAPGGVGFGVTGGWDYPETLRNYLRDNNVKAVFYTDNATGVTVDYGTSSYDNNTVKGHFVFNGGTHVFQKSSESAGLLFGANATADNPTLWVKDNTTLNFKMRNPCGWTSAGGTGGIIRMGNGATVSAQNSASGTWYWSQQFYFDPGSTLNIVTTGFRVVGSDEQSKAQFYMPASEGGTATISSANATTYLQIGDNDYSKMAFDVGAGSTLEITAPLKTLSDSKNFKKYGSGTLKLSGGLVNFKPTASVEGGVLEIATETDFKSGTTMAVASGATLKFGAVSGTFASVISGAGALVKDGADTTTTLTGANTYSGGTTVTAGTLKVAEGASIGTGNYSVAAGATLNLPSTFRPSDAKLIGTSQGTVGITLTVTELASFEGKNEVALIGIDGDAFSGTVKIYDLSGNEYMNTATVKDGKIAVTKVDQKLSPFHVTNPASGNWTAAAWKDSSSPEKDVEESDWAIKVGANLTVEAANTSALTVNRLIQLGTFNVNNAGTLTVSATDNALTADTLTPVNTGNMTLTGNITVAGAIDDSANTGTTTLDFPTHAANITAGKNTIVRGGGTGALTIGAGKMATVKDGLWAGTIPSPTATSTLKFAGTTELATVPYTDNNSFAGTVVYAAPFANQETIGFNGNMTREFDSGLDLTVTKNIQFGNGSGVTQTFNQRGGSITVTGNAEPTSTSAAVLFAHWDGKVYYNLSGGTFTAENAAIRFGWDGKIYFAQSGGTLRTKGIASGGSGTGRNNEATFTLSGGTLELGDYGIQAIGSAAAYTFSGGTIRAYADTSISIAHTDGMKVTGPITIDPNGHTVTISAKLTGSGNITVNDSSSGADGVVKFTGDRTGYSGTITFVNGTVDIGTDRTVPTGYVFQSGVKFAATQTNAEYGKGIASSFTGFTAGQKITLTKLDSTSEELTVNAEGKAASTPGAVHIDLQATIYDATFNDPDNPSVLKYAVNDAHLQYDVNPPTFGGGDPGTKGCGAYIKTHPYIHGAGSVVQTLHDFTVVVVGEMSPTANRIFFHMGSSSAGSDGKGIMITTMEGKDAVGVFSNSSGYSTLTELTTLSVPNAATARHVYAITKREVGGNTIFTIYLDGVKRAEKTIEGTFTLGTSGGHCGVQVGADYGGGIRNNTKYKAVANSDDETGLVNVCRVYDYMLTDAQVTAFTTEYPYITDGGLYSRDVEGSVNYQAENTWTKNDAPTAEYDVPTGTDTSTPSAKLNATAAATITVNTNSVIDTFTFNGKAMTFVKDATGTNAVSVSTAVINAPVTTKYGAVDFSKAAVSLSEGASLTFDMTDFPLTNYFAYAHIQMTGMTAQDDTHIKMVNMPTATGRTTSFAFDPSDGAYYLTITVTPAPFIYTIAEGGTGAWTWNGAPVSEGQVAAQTTGEIQKQGNGTAELPPMALPYNVLAGTLKFTSAPTAPCSITNVAAGATLDLNGIETEAAANNFVVTLNGGTLTNSGTNKGILKSLTVLAKSYVDVGADKVIWIQNQRGGSAATTLTLRNGAILVKNGLGDLAVVTTAVTAEGKNPGISVDYGRLYVQETSNFGEATIRIPVNGKFQVRWDRTATVKYIQGAGGTIEVGSSGISGFELYGETLKFVNAGVYGTITNMEKGVVADVGQKHDITFAGIGQVRAQLSAEYHPSDEVTLFERASDATTTIEPESLTDKNGDAVASKRYTCVTNKVVFKHEANVGDTAHFTLAEAAAAASEGSTVTLLTNVSGGSVSVDKSIVFDGGLTNEVKDVGFSVASGKTLTIKDGYFASEISGEGTYSLIGGKYKDNTTLTSVASGYHYAALADISVVYEGYKYQVIPGSSEEAKVGEKVFPVTLGSTATYQGELAFTKQELFEKGIISSPTMSDTEVLQNSDFNKVMTNGILGWQNAVLNLNGNVATSKPFPAPLQTASGKDKIALKLGGITSVDTKSGATVTYKVLKADSPSAGTWEPASDEVPFDTDSVEVELPESGVKYYKFDVIVAPLK